MNETLVDPPLAWFAVLTKPRQEALAVVHLQRQGFSCLLPMARHSRRTLRGMRESVEALFPRYLFVHAQADGWTLGPVRSTRGVCGVVRFGQRNALIPDLVIAHIRARMPADQCVTLDMPQLKVGDPVRITEGPLAGLRAVFQCPSGRERVRLLMEILGEQVSVVLPKSQLAGGFAENWTKLQAIPA